MQVVVALKFQLKRLDKPDHLSHGTIVEIGQWWPQGSANAGFAFQLARIPKAKLREQIGRRYATLLHHTSENKARLLLNRDPVVGFEHCVWSEERFVERREWGMIPAYARLNTVIASRQRCKRDGTLLRGENPYCLECEGTSFITVDERIHGWVGIQRFDALNRFGIDLIRNGRAIRIEEKDAFFNFRNELGEVSMEYPLDSQFGRIVGEVHLDHVPVDFSKQDFQRSSEEWNRAMDFLRAGSLLPKHWAGETRNSSPVSKLLQGYRRVREGGRRYMYMGKYDIGRGKAVRIDRDTEADYYKRFQDREPGYYDDAKWWELVESADVPPPVGLEDCGHCGYQGLPEAEKCEGCHEILIGKPCASCDVVIQRSATSCHECGSSQIPEVIEPWRCEVCNYTNEVEDDLCVNCEQIRGTAHPLDEESLMSRAVPLEDLCFRERQFRLADGHMSETMSVTVYQVSELHSAWDQPPIPSFSPKSPGKVQVYIDPTHNVFGKLGMRLTDAVAVEVAQYLYNAHSQLLSNKAHSVQNIAATILTTVWGDTLATGFDQVFDAVRTLFEQISDRVPPSDDAADFYDYLDSYETRELADRLIAEGLLEELKALRASGSYLRYASPGVLARFFRTNPDSWFGVVWNRNLPDPSEVGSEAAANAKQQITGAISRCLEDCVAYLRYRETDPLIIARVRAAKEFLDGLLT